MADPSLPIVLGIEVGDRFALGEATFVLKATVENFPGDVGVATSLGPRVFIPRSRVEETGLLEFGARAGHRALEIWPDHTESLTNLGDVRARQGELEQAADLYAKAAEVDARNVIARHRLGQITAQGAQLSRAVALYREALSIDHGNAPVHLSLAIALAQSGDYPGAWQHVREAKRLGLEPPPDFIQLLTRAMPEPARDPREG